jgi:formylglycine-generating enzyme required for sulfatase activity
MRAFRFIVYLYGLLVIASACAPQASPAPQSPSSISPNATSNGAAPAETLVPINLTGPEMKVGSTYLYVDGSVLVAIPAGIFTMGHGGVDNPEHKVNLADFWIYRTKVTNGQYAYCVSAGKCTPLTSQKDNPTFGDPLHASDPMVGVDYSQAETYCGFVNARLPTEAEWEKSARGPDANIYPWGNGMPACDLLNYQSCVGKTTPVNNYPNGRSYYSAFDMEGNAFEWVSDWYKADYYVSGPPDNPIGPATGSERLVRSSSFNSGQNQTQAFNRFFTRPEDHRNNLGFRCLVLDPTYFAPFCQYPAVFGTNGIGGDPNGEKITITCPNISINQNPGCKGLTPFTGVTFDGPKGADITVPTPPPPPQLPICTLDPSNPDKYTCAGNGELKICSQCTITVTSQPQCPNGYKYDASSKSCISQGGKGQCLPGFTLGTTLQRGTALSSNTATPGAQCCSLQTGGSQGIGRIFPFCPAGTFYDGQECVSKPVQSPFCKSQGITLNSCTRNGGNGTCNNPDTSCSSCQFGGTFNASTCSCSCSSG